MKAFVITFVIVLSLGQIYLARASADAVEWTSEQTELLLCEFEDGNTDGKPCLWVDPDTGRVFFVMSDNY